MKQRRMLLKTLMGVLVLLGAFQNCAGPGLSLKTQCAAFELPPERFTYTDRLNGLSLQIDLEAATIHLEYPFSTQSCATQNLTDADVEVLREEIKKLQYVEAVSEDAVAMYLHGKELVYTEGSSDILTSLWLERGDVSGNFKLACSNTEALLQKLDSLTARLESTQSCNRSDPQ